MRGLSLPLVIFLPNRVFSPPGIFFHPNVPQAVVLDDHPSLSFLESASHNSDWVRLPTEEVEKEVEKEVFINVRTYKSKYLPLPFHRLSYKLVKENCSHTQNIKIDWHEVPLNFFILVWTQRYDNDSMIPQYLYWYWPQPSSLSVALHLSSISAVALTLPCRAIFSIFLLTLHN